MQTKIIVNKNKFKFIAGLLLFCLISQPTFAQDDSVESTAPKKSAIKNTFENSVMANNQTTEVNNKKELGFIIQHRFGVIKEQYDFYGIYAPANIRIGLTYGIIKNLTIGLGVTKSRMQYDLEWKYKILHQSKGGGSPISLTYYGDLASSGVKNTVLKNQDNEFKKADRLSFYHEIMISRKFNTHLSVQAGINYSHHNIVDSATLTHNRMGASFLARYKFSAQSSAYVSYNMNLLSLDDQFKPQTNSNDPLKPDFTVGYEVSTGSHQFQVFFGAADGILNQDVRYSNPNDFFKKQIILGFNITRQWGFK